MNRLQRVVSKASRLAGCYDDDTASHVKNVQWGESVPSNKTEHEPAFWAHSCVGGVAALSPRQRLTGGLR